jgi:hypothetical protein
VTGWVRDIALIRDGKKYLLIRSMARKPNPAITMPW